MAIHITEGKEGKILEIVASGKLTHADYQCFVPEYERVAKRHWKVRLLLLLVEFHGWDARGAWDDLKFGVNHASELDRIAVVGDAGWEKVISMLWRPFTQAEVRYFDRGNLAQARTWLEGNRVS